MHPASVGVVATHLPGNHDDRNANSNSLHLMLTVTDAGTPPGRPTNPKQAFGVAHEAQRPR